VTKKADKEAMTVVAELVVTSPLGQETIRSFDKAWERFRELPTPTNCRLTGFVRKTDAELAAG
jgi:hypothetical protein